MSNSKLKLRSPLIVAIAYVVAASAGGIFFGLETWVQNVLDPATKALNEDHLFEFLFGCTLLGAAVCVVVELTLITPLLFGFQQYRWVWLNGLTGALIGFMLGALPALLITSRSSADGTSELLGYYSGGHLTLAGWRHAISSALLIGPIGVICAVVFRVIAVRSCPDSEK